jgi:hypothetical protein
MVSAPTCHECYRIHTGAFTLKSNQSLHKAMLKSLGAQQTKNLLHNICKSNGDVDDVSCYCTALYSCL